MAGGTCGGSCTILTLSLDPYSLEEGGVQKRMARLVGGMVVVYLNGIANAREKLVSFNGGSSSDASVFAGSIPSVFLVTNDISAQHQDLQWASDDCVFAGIMLASTITS